MGFGEAVRTVLRTKYADFSGRAARSEYWWYQLFFVLVLCLLFIPIIAVVAATPTGQEPSTGARATLIATMVVLVVFFLGTLVPGIAVTVRRLHDIGQSGWVYLVTFIPYVGGLVLLVLACKRSEPANKWGPHPYDESGWAAYDLPPAAWYPDPHGVARVRYWDGQAWTEHVSP